MSVSDLPVLEELAGAVLVLTMNLPAKRNALSMALRLQMIERLRMAESDPAIRAIVLCGAGGNFCSGGDISEMASSDAATIRERMAMTHHLVRALALSGTPVVAAVDGWAAGAGMSIALCCDLVVAGADARFVASFGNVGLIGDLGLLHTLPRRVGEAWSRRILLLGEPVAADVAERIGLVNAVVPAGTARDAAIDMAARLAERAPLAMAATKAMLSDGLDALLARELEEQTRLFVTADHAEGKAAFAAKRVPHFSGA